jgi:hypothetical protein
MVAGNRDFVRKYPVATKRAFLSIPMSEATNRPRFHPRFRRCPLEGLPVEIQPIYILPPPPGVIVVQPFPPDPQTEACPPASVQT